MQVNFGAYFGAFLLLLGKHEFSTHMNAFEFSWSSKFKKIRKELMCSYWLECKEVIFEPTLTQFQGNESST